jgi:LysR family transcriptional regulator, cyn operon transcriptional activator
MQLLHNWPMHLRQLRTFVTVADTGGFARALGRLHLSQPAASRQIDALESDLGVVLFERSGRGIRLTSGGEDLLRQSRLVLAQADSLRQRAQALNQGHSGILRLGATPQVIENLLAAFLEHYRRSHPGIEVRLVEDGGARLPARLNQGDVELAIMPSGDERFDGRLLFPMHVFAVLPKTHRLTRRAMLEVSELAHDPLLLLGSGFASREWFEAACQVAHVKPHIVLESAAPHTLIALAKAGYGIAVLPSPASISREAVRAVPLVHRGTSIGRWAIVAWDAQRFLAPYAERFVQEIAAYCRKTFPGRDLIRRAPPLPRPKDEPARRTVGNPRR